MQVFLFRPRGRNTLMGKEEENRVSVSSQSCLSLTITVPDVVLQHHQSPPGSSEAQRTLNLA